MDAAASFELALAFLLRPDIEGGYSNHPDDPGGATNKGITQTVYDGWRISRRLERRDVRQIEDAEVRAIYGERYWARVRGDDLPPAVALVTFDAAVNCGTKRGAEWLQMAVGATVDGDIGPRTLAAVASRDPMAICREALARRLVHHASLRTWPTFGLGWSRRLSALALAAGAILSETSR